MSWSLLLPGLWYFLLCSRSVSRWLHPATGRALLEEVEADGGLGRAVVAALIALGLVVLMRRGPKVRRILADNKTLVALFVYTSLSIVWSNFPATSLFRSIRSIGTFVMVLVVLTDAQPLKAATRVLVGVWSVHLSLSLIAIKYFRNIGVSWNYDGTQEEWIGLALHRNALGQVVMSCAVFCAWWLLSKRNGSRRLGIVPLLLLSLFLLRGSGTSHSSSAIVGFVSGVVTLACVGPLRTYSRRRLVVIVAVATLSVVAAAGALAGDVIGARTALLTALGREESLTGRRELWADLVENASKNPVAGVGFGAFWVGSRGETLYPLPRWMAATPEWRPNEGHNGYLDVYVELGWIGVLVLGVVLIGFVRESKMCLKTDFEFASLRLGLLIPVLLNNVTESSLMRGTHSLWFIFLLCTTSIPASAVRAASSKVLVRPAVRSWSGHRTSSERGPGRLRRGNVAWRRSSA